MIEPNIARLWERAASHKMPFDAAAAREALRELGLNPFAPPPEAEVKASLAGLSPSLVTPAQAGVQCGAADDEDGIPGQARDDDIEAQDDDIAARDDEIEPVKLPTPVRPARHNEWTRAKMVAFLRELAACQSVSQAAKSVGMGRQSAYKLRNRLHGTPFSLAWEAALEAGLQQLAHAVLDRAVNGEERPLYYHGELVGTWRKHDNRLAAWLLANPGKLGREPQARALATREWEDLLVRIECDCHEWYPGEELTCAPREYAAGDGDTDEGEGEGEAGVGETAADAA